MHPGFYSIIKGIRPDINIDLLTNCQFNVEEFARKIPPGRLKREAPYASIRVSFHPATMDLDSTIQRVLYLQERGYSIGVWIVDYPYDMLIRAYQKLFQSHGIDCRLKEYLDGKTHGTYRYMELQGKKNVLCRPSELLLAPDGSIHRCHGDLYGNRPAIGNITQRDVQLRSGYTPCKRVDCTSCDVKIKTNRFQEYGHCAVDIKEIQ